MQLHLEQWSLWRDQQQESERTGSAKIPKLFLEPHQQQLQPSGSSALPLFVPEPTRKVSMLQSGYWGRAAMYPEPGRCRRTDGKKWGCSRDVAAEHKYCERHLHRGRNRSRKHVEVSTPTSATASIPILGDGSGGGLTASGTLKPTNTITISSPLAEMANGTGVGVSGPLPSIDLLHFNQR